MLELSFDGNSSGLEFDFDNHGTPQKAVELPGKEHICISDE